MTEQPAELQENEQDVLQATLPEYTKVGAANDHQQTQATISMGAADATGIKDGNQREGREGESGRNRSERTNTNEAPDAEEYAIQSTAAIETEANLNGKDEAEPQKAGERSGEDDSSSSSGRDGYWDSLWERWTPEKGGYFMVRYSSDGVPWSYYRRPANFWTGPCKVRPDEYDDLQYHDLDNRHVLPVFVSRRMDQEFREKVDAEGLVWPNGTVDNWNVLPLSKPRDKDESEDKGTNTAADEGARDGGDERTVADCYMVPDATARGTPGTICYPRNKAELEKAVKLAGDTFDTVCIWTEIRVDGITDDYETFEDDWYKADGLIVIIDKNYVDDPKDSTDGWQLFKEKKKKKT